MTSAKDIQIRIADKIDRAKWDSYVHGHPDASPYHLYGWGQAVEKAYGFKKLYFVAEKDNTFVGVLPVVIHAIPFVTKRLVSMPYCDLGSPLVDSREISAALVKRLIEMAKKLAIDEIELRGLDEELLADTCHQVEEVKDKVRMLLELPESSEVLWTGFKSKLRSQVRKAEKNDLYFQFDNQNVDVFYSVFSRNMHDLGSPVHAKKFIAEIIRQLGEHAWTGLVFHNKLPIGAGIILRSGQNICIPWASTLREYNRLNPNMLLYWNFLKFAADSGTVRFDFGRSTPNEGTYRFKAQWGAVPQQLVWQKIHLNKKTLSRNHSENKYRERAEKIWCRMPSSVANIVGPIVRRYITL